MHVEVMCTNCLRSFSEERFAQHKQLYFVDGVWSCVGPALDRNDGQQASQAGEVKVEDEARKYFEVCSD